MENEEKWRLAKLRTENPALTDPRWLPETDWTELEELRAEHRRVLTQAQEIADERGDLATKFENEDEARAEAMRERYRTGEEVEVPEVTPPEERERVFAEIEERRIAAVNAVDEFLHEAVGSIREHETAWLADLVSKQTEAARRAEEARRIADEAEAEVELLPRLEMWIKRTTQGRVGWHIPAHQLMNTEPETVLQIANRGVPRPFEAKAQEVA